MFIEREKLFINCNGEYKIETSIQLSALYIFRLSNTAIKLQKKIIFIILIK